MSWQDDALKRIDGLIEEGEQLPTQPSARGDSVKGAPFYGWRTKAIAGLTDLLGTDHIYTSQFIERATTSWLTDRDAGVAILKALRSDVENGYLRKLASIVSAEVFGDFLEMAEHLLEEGYKDPSASLIGAVLEDGLRRIAVNEDIPVTPSDDLGSLPNKCVNKGLFNRIVQQEIAVWTKIRNSAAHGKFEEYTSGQVTSMLSGVRSFLGTHLT